MSIPEATQLVLQAGLMGSGGEIFVLEMGEPVRIADLARDMIRLSGLTDDDIEIRYSGLRPGEKLFEELLANDETTQPTPHPKLRISRSLEPPTAQWAAEVSQWLDSQASFRDPEVRGWLKRFVPEYAPAPGLDVIERDTLGTPIEPDAEAPLLDGQPVRLVLVSTGTDTEAPPGGASTRPPRRATPDGRDD
jgi:hypothetical protein